MGVGEELRREELHLQELGIATLTSVYCNSQIDTKKQEPIKPNAFFYFAPGDPEQVQIDGVAADVFFSLVKDSKLPQWALSICPLDRLRSSRIEGSAPQKNRAWMKRGVLLLLPRIVGTRVIAPLAIVDGVDGAVPVIDIDSGAARQVLVPNAKKERFWICDYELEITGGSL